MLVMQNGAEMLKSRDNKIPVSVSSGPNVQPQLGLRASILISTSTRGRTSLSTGLEAYTRGLGVLS